MLHSFLLIVAAIAQLVYSLGMIKDQQKSFIWSFLAGTTFLAAGLFLTIFPAANAQILTLVLMGFLAFAGLFEIAMGYASKDIPAQSWVIFNGFISLVLAISLGVILPESAPWAIGLFVGAKLFISGVTLLLLTAQFSQKKITKARPSFRTGFQPHG